MNKLLEINVYNATALVTWTNMKNPVGRPEIKITDEMLAKAEAYASRGLTIEQIALALDLGESTLYEKLNKYSDLSDAIKRGKATGIAHVADKLLTNVDNGNVTAQIFYLKCQAKWKEAQSLEHSGPDGAPIKFEDQNKITAREELKNLISKALDKSSSKED